MHVVIVDSDVSYPATSGKRLRTLNLMLHAARRHDITYVGRCAAGSVEDREAPAFLRRHGIEPVIVHDPLAKKSGPAFYVRLALNLLSSEPYSMASHRSRAVAAALTQVARRRPVDLWQFEWLSCFRLLDPTLPGARLVVAHNVETLLWQRYYTAATNPLTRWYLKQQWRKFERCEGAVFREADRVVAVSDDDADLVATRFGQPNVDVVDNGVDPAYFIAGVGPRAPYTILFLGALDWRPNIDAVHWLLDRIFPQVRHEIPEARLQIVGRQPSATLVRRVAECAGVELHGDVADVRPFLTRAAVMAVPLRIGGGSRLKILEALASGLPVVATPVGAEGLNLKPGEHYDAADLDQLAEALVRALREPERIQVQAERGRRLVIEQYAWEVLARKLEQSWQRCVAEWAETNSEPSATLAKAGV
ncbi:MAG: glycosyltransferase family 4 protein [Gemmataceae bacterium]|nr:glycosyltransferase family 4 protein [Gemmataceae bacterium]